jgi:hypothetical protein
MMSKFFFRLMTVTKLAVKKGKTSSTYIYMVAWAEPLAKQQISARWQPSKRTPKTKKKS